MAEVDVRFHELVIDCAHPRSLADFWCRVTGYTLVHAHDSWCTIQAADEAMTFGFQKVPEPKSVKNRLHVDLSAPDEEAAALAVEAMGAVRLWVSTNPDDPFVVLADPEGNEFCIVRDDD